MSLNQDYLDLIFKAQQESIVNINEALVKFVLSIKQNGYIKKVNYTFQNPNINFTFTTKSDYEIEIPFWELLEQIEGERFLLLDESDDYIAVEFSGYKYDDLEDISIALDSIFEHTESRTIDFLQKNIGLKNANRENIKKKGSGPKI